jgi:tRNA(Ile)-lysidine synthase
MAEPGRLKQLVGAVLERAVFPSPPHVVALSGGADSAALAYLSADAGHLKSCLHVHHGLPASDDLALAARGIAAAIGVEVVVLRVEVPDGPSPENQARHVRYQAIESASSTSAPLLTGHTRNDQAETVLMNLIRGAGGRGLTGIPYHRPPNIYRPLLDVSRSETRELATLAHLRFLDDPLNNDRSLRRNLIRTDVIPRLEGFNPNLVEALARVAGQVGADVDLLDSLAAAVPISVEPHRASVAAAAVLILPVPLQVRVLRRLIAALRGPDGLTTAELDRVRMVLSGSIGATELGSGLRVSRQTALLMVESHDPGNAH